MKNQNIAHISSKVFEELSIIHEQAINEMDNTNKTISKKDLEYYFRSISLIDDDFLEFEYEKAIKEIRKYKAKLFFNNFFDSKETDRKGYAYNYFIRLNRNCENNYFNLSILSSNIIENEDFTQENLETYIKYYDYCKKYRRLTDEVTSKDINFKSSSSVTEMIELEEAYNNLNLKYNLVCENVDNILSGENKKQEEKVYKK